MNTEIIHFYYGAENANDSICDLQLIRYFYIFGIDLLLHKNT